MTLFREFSHILQSPSLLNFHFTSIHNRSIPQGSICTPNWTIQKSWSMLPDCRSNEDPSDVLGWPMYHECLSTSLLSLRIVARTMQETCGMQILYSCLWIYFFLRRDYGVLFPTYFCFFKSSGLLLLLLEPTLSLVRVLLLDPRLSLVRVAAANLVF